MAFPPHREPVLAGGEEGQDVGSDDGTLSGWWHYQRCRVMLESEMERPTLSTLQCLVFSVIYLCCASFQNMAHHCSPWLYASLARSDCTSSRPRTCRAPRGAAEAPLLMSCSLPADDHALALQSSCSNTASITVEGSTVTWLTYTLQNAKLVLAARDVYVPFYERCAEILGSKGASLCTWSLYDDAAALETAAADAQERHMDGPRGLKAWLRDTQRVGQGIPLSTDLSRLDIEMFAPAWLQRQRLFLELLYHTLMTNLHRLFIAFPAMAESASSSLAPKPGPLTTAHATTAARHSIAITAILH
ncbi:hypothetical protein C8A03DRAFT_37939 [Achaetomium macrosporum]|uniref:Uncharacterized protein n=1 Tax=Achaetomium macrosporum TaxID=79813 RepID=A0AAN7HAX1_9PEZI|nr:hypothetical protein C8A03DRAFT_37939 [Achaetomium macrosporum]